MTLVYSSFFIISIEFIACRSEQRDFSQRLCGWTFDKTNVESFRIFIDDLCVKKVSKYHVIDLNVPKVSW